MVLLLALISTLEHVEERKISNYTIYENTTYDKLHDAQYFYMQKTLTMFDDNALHGIVIYGLIMNL